jgi:hypothetical protein
MQALLHRGKRLDGMPMVGSGNHHRVQIGNFECLTEVGETPAVLVSISLVNDGLGMRQTQAVHIADGDDPDLGIPRKVAMLTWMPCRPVPIMARFKRLEGASAPRSATGRMENPAPVRTKVLRACLRVFMVVRALGILTRTKRMIFTCVRCMADSCTGFSADLQGSHHTLVVDGE